MATVKLEEFALEYAEKEKKLTKNRLIMADNEVNIYLL